jgi:hypothetical protein
MHRQRLFLFLVPLVAAAATPALGQAVAPTVGPASSGTQGAAYIPDFSGAWVHPANPGFEPLPSGPTSLVNRSRRPDGSGNVQQLVGDYTNPISRRRE